MISQESWDVVVTDLQMGEVDGIEILRQTKEELPDAEVIVLTGHGSITSAVTAMQHGAYTYLTKPLDIGIVLMDLNKPEDNYGEADLPMGILPMTDELVFLQMDGDLSMDEFQLAWDYNIKAAHEVHEIMVEALKKRYGGEA